MTEIEFIVEDNPNGGYTASALEKSIVTQADDLETLRIIVRDVVLSHFPEQEKRPKTIRLHIVKNELMMLLSL